MRVLKLSDLSNASFKCDKCGRLFPCLLSLSGHTIGKHKHNILACPNHKNHKIRGGKGARLLFTLGSPKPASRRQKVKRGKAKRHR